MENIVSLTPVGLFLQAGPVAKIVLSLLLVASIWCWVLIIEGIWGVVALRRAIRAARAAGQYMASGALLPVIEAGRHAAALSIAGETVGERRARIAESMDRAAQTLLSRVEGGLPNLAVISSVAPFIGLFGTVWGIMVSFSSIGAAQDTSLAIVAPGIADALAATAIGLAAAIPAVFFYNWIDKSVGDFVSELEASAAEWVALVTEPPPPMDTTIPLVASARPGSRPR